MKATYIHTYIHALYISSWIGGAVNESGCDNIPEYPFCSGVRQDNMRTLCKQSFEVGLRIANNPTNSNPTINKMCQVKCPRSLWTATGAFLPYIYIYTYIPKRFSQRNSWTFFGSTLYKGIIQPLPSMYVCVSVTRAKHVFSFPIKCIIEKNIVSVYTYIHNMEPNSFLWSRTPPLGRKQHQLSMQQHVGTRWRNSQS